MLLTVTLNPSLDRILTVPELTAGAVHRSETVQTLASGKGLNVARAAQTLGPKVLATGPLGGHIGRLVAELATEQQLDGAWYWLKAGETRVSVLVNHANGTTTVLNEPGPVLSYQAWRALSKHILEQATPAQAVAFSGSVPPGVDPGEFAALARALASPTRPVYIDTSGAMLKTVAANPSKLSIKVNQSELAAALGSGVDGGDMATTLQMAKTVIERGAAMVVITMGAAGALAVTPEAGWVARPPAVTVISVVGSGDAFLAGLAVSLLGRGQSIADALRLAVACGTANATTAQPGIFRRDLVDRLGAQVEVRQIT